MTGSEWRLCKEVDGSSAMANVILPIAMYLTLGGPMNMLNYDDYREKPSIFCNTDIIEIEYHQPRLNSSFYILQEDRLPYSAMGLPIDLLLRVKSNRFPESIIYDIPRMVHKDPIHDAVTLVIVTEYVTGRHMVSPSAAPLSNWHQSVPETATHYVEELVFGGKCIAKVEVKSSVTGDVQIIRKIFTEAMGTSGNFEKKDVRAFTALWKYAMRSAKDSPDVRGSVYLNDFSVQCTNIEMPFEVKNNFEKFLAYLPSIPVPKPTDEQTNLYVSFRPLHSLDVQYPLVEKNNQTEEYLTSLDEKIDDLQKVIMNGYLIPRSEENKLLKGNFWKKVGSLRMKLHDLLLQKISIYKNINVAEFDSVFQQYNAGLDEGEKSYFSAWKKLLENIEMTCGDKFRKPTSGILVANEDEVAHLRSLKEGLKACKGYCRKEERCRAIGYDKTNPKMCSVYSVSTNTAAIYSPEAVDSMKIYDRQCRST